MLEASLAEAKEKAEAAGGNDETLNQAVNDAETALTDAKANPIKKELQNKKQFTKRERLNFEKRKIEEQLSDLDKEDGVKRPIDADDNTPLTVGMLKQREKELAQKTALELAEAIEDADERELSKKYLLERIIPSGNPHEDLRFARSAVNSLKNAQIAEEEERKRNPQKFPNNPGGPGKRQDTFTPTAEEITFMQPPYNLTQADILKARQKNLLKNQ